MPLLIAPFEGEGIAERRSCRIHPFGQLEKAVDGMGLDQASPRASLPGGSGTIRHTGWSEPRPATSPRSALQDRPERNAGSEAHPARRPSSTPCVPARRGCAVARALRRPRIRRRPRRQIAPCSRPGYCETNRQSGGCSRATRGRRELLLAPALDDGEEVEIRIAVEPVEIQPGRAQSDQRQGLVGPGERGADLVQPGQQELQPAQGHGNPSVGRLYRAAWLV